VARSEPTRRRARSLSQAWQSAGGPALPPAKYDGPSPGSGSPRRRQSAARAWTFRPSNVIALAISILVTIRPVAVRAASATATASGVGARFMAIRAESSRAQASSKARRSAKRLASKCCGADLIEERLSPRNMLSRSTRLDTMLRPSCSQPASDVGGDGSYPKLE
jgi:hypothetical protein